MISAIPSWPVTIPLMIARGLWLVAGVLAAAAIFLSGIGTGRADEAASARTLWHEIAEVRPHIPNTSRHGGFQRYTPPSRAPLIEPVNPRDYRRYAPGRRHYRYRRHYGSGTRDDPNAFYRPGFERHRYHRPHYRRLHRFER